MNGVQPEVFGPTASVVVDVSLEYLRVNAVDVSAVIDNAQTAVAGLINGSSTSATITSDAITEAVAATPGILAVLSAMIDGGDSFTGAGGSQSYLVLKTGVNIEVRTLS